MYRTNEPKSERIILIRATERSLASLATVIVKFYLFFDGPLEFILTRFNWYMYVQEKRKVVEENEELKKKMQKVSDKLEKANSDLNNSEEEKRKLGQRLNEMETHRDLLLDKVL